MFRRLKKEKVDAETLSDIKVLQKLKLNVREVKKCYAALVKYDISRSVKDICKTSDLIVKEVSLNHDKIGQVNLFVEYYIPVLIKMLHQYIDIKENKLLGEDSAKTMRAIEEMLPKIQFAFSELLNQLFHNENRDVDADIKVMIKELMQRGLLDD